MHDCGSGYFNISSVRSSVQESSCRRASKNKNDVPGLLPKGKDVRRRATVKQSVKGVRQGIFIRLDGLSPIPARKRLIMYVKTPILLLFRAASCCVLRASTRTPAQHSSSSSVAETDIDTQQPVVGRNIRPPWMPFWGWGNVLSRSRVRASAQLLRCNPGAKQGGERPQSAESLLIARGRF